MRVHAEPMSRALGEAVTIGLRPCRDQERDRSARGYVKLEVTVAVVGGDCVGNDHRTDGVC